MTYPARQLAPAIECEEASELLSAWIDGELSAGEAQTLDRHLAGCERCRAEQNRLEEVSAAFRSVTPVAPPPRVRQEVLDRIREENRGLGDPPATARRRSLGLRRWLTAAALLLAMGGGLWWVGGSRAVPPEVRGAAAPNGYEAMAADLGADAGCGPAGDCFHMAPCDSPAECGGGPPCSDPGECDGVLALGR